MNSSLIPCVRVDYLGNDLSDGHYVSTGSAAECQLQCQYTSQCNYWTWDP